MRRTLLLAAWLLTDLLVFTACYTGAYFLRVGFIFSSDFPFDRFLYAVLLTAPAWLAMLIGTRTFALLRAQRSPRTFAYILFAGVGGAALFSLVYYFLFGAFFSRLLLATALVLSVVATWAWHLAFGFLSRTLMRSAPASYPTLIVGATRESSALIKSLQDKKNPLKPVAVLDGKGTRETDIHGVPVLGKLNKLEETLEKHEITHLIQCSDLEQSLNLLSACRKRGIAYVLLPSVLGIVERDEKVEVLEGRQVTVVRPRGPLWEWFFQ
jgi:FlaA1/EpsC-like NDP-sugar epimerase